MPLNMQEQLIVGLGALLLLVLAAFGIHTHGVHKGAAAERAVWLEASARLIRKHDEQIAALTLQFNLNNQKVSDDHEKELAKAHDDAAADRAAADRTGGLRIARAVCDRPAAPATAAGAGGRDEAAAATVRLPRAVENDLWASAAAADEVTAQARACQSWIRESGFYGATPVPAP